jgi:hypothetical protein
MCVRRVLTNEARIDEDFQFETKQLEQLRNELAQPANRAEYGKSRLRSEIEREMRRRGRDFGDREESFEMPVRPLKEELATLSSHVQQFTVED